MISSQIERFEGSEVADLDGQVRDLVAGSILRKEKNRFNTFQLLFSYLGTTFRKTDFLGTSHHIIFLLLSSFQDL
jgi:hypothetical protein